MLKQEFDPGRRRTLRLVLLSPMAVLAAACGELVTTKPIIRELNGRQEIDQIIKQYRGREFQFAPPGKEGVVYPSAVGEISSFDSKRQELKVSLGGGAPAVFHETVGLAERFVYRGPGFLNLTISPNSPNPQERTAISTVSCKKFGVFFDPVTGGVTVGGEECSWQEEGYARLVESFVHIQPLNLAEDLSLQELYKILSPGRAVWARMETGFEVEVISKGKFQGEELLNILADTANRTGSVEIAMKPNLVVTWGS